MIEVDDIQLQSSLVVRDASGEDAGLGLLAVRDSRGWVGGMAVAPTWRRQGLGAWLIAEVLAQASALGLETVELEVLEENTAAYHLYQRAGFQVVRLLSVFEGSLMPPPAQAADRLPRRGNIRAWAPSSSKRPSATSRRSTRCRRLGNASRPPIPPGSQAGRSGSLEQ